MVDSAPVREIRKKDDKSVLMLPGDIEGKEDVTLLEQGEILGLGLPTDADIADYFKKPGALAVERKRKTGSGSYAGGGDENPGGYEK